MSAHTHTEWRYQGTTVYALNLEGSNRFHAHIQPGWATQGRTRTDESECEANARLIAAVPDYCVATQAIFDAIESNAAPINVMAALRHLDKHGERVSLDADLLIALFEAHSKATGGAP